MTFIDGVSDDKDFEDIQVSGVCVGWGGVGWNYLCKMNSNILLVISLRTVLSYEFMLHFPFTYSVTSYCTLSQSVTYYLFVFYFIYLHVLS